MVADTSSATHLISTSKKHDTIDGCRVKVKDAFEVDIAQHNVAYIRPAR